MDPSASLRDLPQGEEKVRRVRAMFDAIAPRYERTNTVLSLGLDSRWRRQAVRALRLPPGSRVLDVAAGTGSLCEAGRAFGLSVVGVDLSAGMLTAARTAAPLVEGDAAALPVPDGAVDGVLCGFALRNFADLETCLIEMARVLRPGGRVALLEVGDPAGRLTRAGYAAWFEHAVPFLGGLLSDRAAYAYLPASVRYLPPPEELTAMLRSCGFSGVNRRLLTGGLSQLYAATRSGR